MTLTKEKKTVSDLYDLRYELQEAYSNRDSYMVREQVIRFEELHRYFGRLFYLNSRYSAAIRELKLMVFKGSNYPKIQERLLEEVRRMILDVNYLS